MLQLKTELPPMAVVKKTGRPKAENPKVRYNLYLDQDVLSKVNELAEKRGYSTSQLINLELKKLLKIK